jgi:hypothetical protein
MGISAKEHFTVMNKIARIAFLLTVLCILTTDLDEVTSAQGQKAISNALRADVRFASGNGALKIPFELYNNHIYLKVSVNGSSPLSFLLDTGAPHIIDLKQARAIGLKLKFEGQATGVGEGTVGFYSSNGITFNLPGVSLSGQRVGVLPLEPVAVCASEIVVDERGHLQKCGPDKQRCQKRVIDGVLGHDFFTRFVVEIDYGSRLINLYTPENYKYQGTGESFPLEIKDQKIYVKGRLSLSGRAPIDGRFLIDTGNASSLFLTRRFVDANRLLPPAPELTRFFVCGIGGDSEILIGTLSALQLGNIKISGPVTGFAQAKNGELADADYAGNIGGAILRHFKVVFDYSHGRMILESLPKE